MRRGIVVLAFLLAFLSVAGSVRAAPGADTLAEVKKKGALVVGVRGDTPPLAFVDRATGKVVGVEPDLAAAVAKRIGVKLELKRLDAEERMQALLGRDVDLLVASMTSTADRDRFLDFSAAYFRTTQGVLARKGAVGSVEALKGKKVAAAPGSPSEKALREKVPSAACYLFTDPAKAIEALRKGEVDAISASGAALYGCLEGLPREEFEVSPGVALAEDRYRVAVRKGDTALLGEVNATLEELGKTGEATAILDRWFRAAPSAPAPGTPAATAVGAVTRTTGTAGRYVVVPVRGIFRTGAEVSLFDPEGNPLGKGRVSGSYEDEVYVDAPSLPGPPQAGSPVAMNLRQEDVKVFLAARGDLFSDLKATVKREEEQRNREETARFERERKERERYQEDITKTKMYLDYQYSDYYRYYPYWP